MVSFHALCSTSPEADGSFGLQNYLEDLSIDTKGHSGDRMVNIWNQKLSLATMLWQLGILFSHFCKVLLLGNWIAKKLKAAGKATEGKQHKIQAKSN